MNMHRKRVFLWSGLLVAGNLISIAFLALCFQATSSSEALLLGYTLGSFFANTTLAAAWTTFGPAKLLWRLPLSMCWMCLLGGMTCINILMNDGPLELLLIFIASFLGLWLAVQIPLWSLKIGLRVRLLHRDESPLASPKEWQFGIRQLLSITTMVAIAFAVGRVAVSSVHAHGDLSLGGLPVFLFLAASAIAFSLLLLLATLQERLLLGLAIVSLVIVIGTVVEVPLVQRISGAATGPHLSDMVTINAMTCGLVFFVAMIFRVCGYKLTLVGPRSSPAVPNL